MDANGWLLLLLVIALVIMFSMKSRLDRLSSDMHGQAMEMFQAWKQRETDGVRSEQIALARREAEAELQQWKISAERRIRQDAIERSQAVTVGKVTEHIAPYLPDFCYSPKDARFIGSPVDFVVFDGLNDGPVTQIVFVEVKSGGSVLTTRERQVRDAVKAGRVRWEELRVSSELSR